jgi:hypothetical protein
MATWYIGNFVAEDGTKFWQGPWFLDGDKYDYKLEEADGSIDYCDEDQMLEWDVKPKRELKK